jgi:hypothetical protein
MPLTGRAYRVAVYPPVTRDDFYMTMQRPGRTFWGPEQARPRPKPRPVSPFAPQGPTPGSLPPAGRPEPEHPTRPGEPPSAAAKPPAPAPSRPPGPKRIVVSSYAGRLAGRPKFSTAWWKTPPAMIPLIRFGPCAPDLYP